MLYRRPVLTGYVFDYFVFFVAFVCLFLRVGLYFSCVFWICFGALGCFCPLLCRFAIAVCIFGVFFESWFWVSELQSVLLPISSPFPYSFLLRVVGFYLILQVLDSFFLPLISFCDLVWLGFLPLYPLLVFSCFLRFGFSFPFLFLYYWRLTLLYRGLLLVLSIVFSSLLPVLVFLLLFGAVF